MESRQFTHYDNSVSELEKLILSIQEQGGFLSPDHASRLRAIVRKNNQSRDDPMPSKAQQYALTEREQQVADGLMAGQSYQEIADANYISINTVRHYVKALYKKLDVSNRVQLIHKLRFPEY